MRPIVFSLTLAGFLLCGKKSLLSSEEEMKWARRIQSQLIIKNEIEAIREAELALNRFPQSFSLHESYIQALSRTDDERKLILAWEKMISLFPEQIKNRELLESMSWGILRKSFRSASIIMREMALLAAFFSQDSKGVAILKQGMCDFNYAVRTIAVKLGSHFRDHSLVEQVKKMFKEETVWSVRKQVIEAIGKMKIVDFKFELTALIASEESLPQEKQLAIASLLELLELINREEIEKLAFSNRSGLRQLACQAIAHFQSIRDLDQLIRLGKDPHPEVRLAAIQALGQLHPKQQIERVTQLAKDSTRDFNHKVALAGGWLLTLYDPEEGQKCIVTFLTDRRSDIRAFAAAVLAATGRYGITLALDQFRHHQDSMVRLNLAMGLIGQRCACEEAAAFLKQMLNQDKEKWKKIDVGNFHVYYHPFGKRIEDSDLSYEVENQMLRLELFNILAILKTPNIHEAIRSYLNERTWEITATAALLLLTEGDETAIGIVQQLLYDSQPRVRLHAALILSLWSREESAIQALEEGYANANSDWQTRAHILEGIGRIGSTRSIPFLIQRLKEPSQTLRLIAAMAIIQCVNH